MSQSLQALFARAQVWNGSAWVNAPGDAANGLDVDVTRSVLPTGASTEATLAGVKTGTDKIPSSPAQEHATAGSPHSARLTDGATYLGTTAQRLHISDGGVALAVSGPLTDAQLRASAVPVSMATNTPDVTDRAARLLGHVTVDAGDVDHDAVNTGKVVQVGGHAAVDSPAPVAAGDRVRAWYGLHGEQKVSNARPWTNTGDYRAVTLALAHAAAADAATGGRWWLINPVGSSVAIAVLRVMIYHGFTAAAAQLTIPRITLERFTFTGTASGASLTPSKRVRTATQGQTVDAAAAGSVRTASTGMTIAAGEVEHAWLPPTALTAVGAVANSWSYYGVSERGEDALILAPGEGLVCRQADASATGRSWLNTIDWSEFTT